MDKFKLKSNLQPAGDQPEAIKGLINGLHKNNRYQTLLGVTGSGKTFTMANVIATTNRPALVIAHNKTLAAQLTNEFREFFPDNAVEYFVSYYDYYQPEAYLPNSDTYIEKEAQINDEIDRLRHSATQSLLTRRDVIIVASVSCIYGLGSPDLYKAGLITLHKNEILDRSNLMRRLLNLQYERTVGELRRGTFRTRGPSFDIFPADQDIIYRLTISSGRLADIQALDSLTKAVKNNPTSVYIFPATHFVTTPANRTRALKSIRAELNQQLTKLKSEDKLLAAERLSRRTKYDLAMIREVGYTNGIENYSRHLDGRKPGDPAFTLLDYFPKDFLLFIDESHVTIPQLNGMYNGDRARKTSLIDNGFRLPSAYDNRPLRFPEFQAKIGQGIFVSATPGNFEAEHSDQVVEQVIRPTGLLDPEVIVRPIVPSTKQAKSQVEDLIIEAKLRATKQERVLVTTLTKKMAEDLTEYLKDQGVKTEYLHSEVQTLDRIRLLTEFRQGKFDCLVGVNLLREGLDLPEVTLVAILDADKEGFLRSATALIQTIGRASRNAAGRVILYADTITGSMRRALDETNRRRTKQMAYNKTHGLTPTTIKRNISDITKLWGIKGDKVEDILKLETKVVAPDKIKDLIRQKEIEMKEASHNLEFELAALLRDEIKLLKNKILKK